jgi:hypothetical protein
MGWTSDTLIVRWVDRLGRNYSDVTDTVREFYSPWRDKVLGRAVERHVVDDPPDKGSRDLERGTVASASGALPRCAVADGFLAYLR